MSRRISPFTVSVSFAAAGKRWQGAMSRRERRGRVGGRSQNYHKVCFSGQGLDSLTARAGASPAPIGFNSITPIVSSFGISTIYLATAVRENCEPRTAAFGEAWVNREQFYAIM